jgi:hypothetical protein
MVRALEEHCGDVITIGPLQPFSLRLGKLIGRVVRRISNHPYLYTHGSYVSMELGRMAQKRLDRAKFDVIFASAASTVVAHLKTQLPIVYLSDATVRLMINYYPEFSNLFPFQVRAADEIELLGIGKAAELIYPSTWAARSAIDDYHADASKVHVVPFGLISTSRLHTEIFHPRSRTVGVGCCLSASTGSRRAEISPLRHSYTWSVLEYPRS